MKIGIPNQVNNSSSQTPSGNSSTSTIAKMGLISVLLLSRFAQATDSSTQIPSLRGVSQNPVNTGGSNLDLKTGPSLVKSLPDLGAASMSLVEQEDSATGLSEPRALQSGTPASLADMNRYINGDQANQLAPDNMLTDARNFLSANPFPAVAESATPFQAELFVFLANEHAKRSPVVSAFTEWRSENGRGGTRGEGSGLIYINQMLGMRNDLVEFTGDDSIPAWTQFSSSIANTYPIPNGATRNPLSGGGYEFNFPSYLTVEGGEDSLTLFGRPGTITKLGDFINPDEVGIAVGKEVQRRALTNIRGTVTATNAAADPIYYIIQEGLLLNPLENFLGTEAGQTYLNTDEGQAWAAAKDQLSGLGTAAPTTTPTQSATLAPTTSPTKAPTEPPTRRPTAHPTQYPTARPTSSEPTSSPTPLPPGETHTPTASPVASTLAPTPVPTPGPTSRPNSPTTPAPTARETDGSTSAPTGSSSSPTVTAAPVLPPTGDPAEEASTASSAIISVVFALCTFGCLGGTGLYVWNKCNGGETGPNNNDQNDNQNGHV